MTKNDPAGIYSDESLGGTLRRRRRAVDKTIADLARALGVNYNTLGGYERGEKLPDVDFLARFAQVTGSSFLDLLAARLRAMDSEAGRRALAEVPAPEAARGAGFAESWGAALDTALLEEILREIEAWLEARGAVLTAEKKAKAAALFYQMFADSGRVEPAQVEKVLELLG